MAKLKNFSKVNPVNHAKLFLISSLATVMVTVNFDLFQPVVANAEITEQTVNISDGIENLTQVRLAGPFNELNNSVDASQQKVQVKGSYHAGDLVQVMLNGTAFVGVVPNDTKVGVQITLPIVVQQSRLNVVIEETLYQGNIISD